MPASVVFSEETEAVTLCQSVIRLYRRDNQSIKALKTDHVAGPQYASVFLVPHVSEQRDCRAWRRSPGGRALH